MSQEKIEAIILTKDGIMIQDITVMVRSDYEPILRIPSVEEIAKVTDGCKNSLEFMKKTAEKKNTSEVQIDIMFNEMVEKYGIDNVKIEDGVIYITDNGKEYKIKVEST